MKVFKRAFAGFVACAMVLSGCQKQVSNTETKNGKIKIVAITSLIADMAKQIGQDLVDVTALMGAGVDAHVYSPSAGDISALKNADLIAYNGLHLEGKMESIFDDLENQGKHIVLISEKISEEKLVEESEEHHEHHSHDDCEEHDHEHEHFEYDSHISFDGMLLEDASKNMLNALVELSPENKSVFEENFAKFEKELEELDTYIKEQVSLIPKEARVLITAHHSFAYFGKAYGFEVKGLQGISTSAEAGTKDIADLAEFIAEHKIKAIFVENSMSAKSIEALQEAVKAKGFDVKLGGELFSDSLGDKEENSTYIGMMKSNINTIVNSLK